MVAVFVLDGRLHCGFMNNVAEFLTGLANAQAVGRHIGVLLWPDDSQRFQQSVIGQALSEGGAHEGQETLIGHDGFERPFAFRVAPLGAGLEDGVVLELLDLSGETGTSRALRESEQRLRLAIEATHIGIWDVDVTRGTRRWSPEFNAILGFPVDFEGKQDAFESLIHPDDHRRVTELYERAYAPGSDGNYSAEFRIRRADTGELRWVATTGRITFGAEGKALRGIGTLRDIDQRRKDEEAVRESERTLRVALVAGRMGAWSYDLKTGTQRWDESQYRLFGLDPSIPPSRDLFLSIVHPDDLAAVAFESETLPLDTYLDSEFRIIRPDGETRWISAHSIAHAGPDGTPMEMIGVNRDMTAQKSSETALRIAEERQRLAVEANDVGTWDFDMVAGKHLWSAQFRKLWGLPADAPADVKELHPLVDPVDWVKIRERWRAASDPASDGRIALEYRIRRANDDARRWAMFNGRIFFDEAHRRPVRAVGVMLDITERREAEERQRLILRELNHRVKNNLAVVQAIVSQTMRMSPKPAEAFERIQARLMAISRTHDFLNMSDWGGVSLGRLLQGELEPHTSLDRQRIMLSGQVIELDSTTALSLGLVFHELATNATKYGALSSETGRLQVKWELIGEDHNTVSIDWVESGGPPVRTPRRRGFGSRLIEGSVQGRLGGTIEMDFAREGLRCRMTFQLPREPQPPSTS
jgi:PAS domain S-box-containing protein